MNYLEVRERAEQRRVFMRENTHLTDQKIAIELGMQVQSVRKAAREHNIPIIMINPNEDLRKKRIAFIEKNPSMTAKEIGDVLHMEPVVVNRFIKKHNLKIKSVYTQPLLSIEQRIEFIKCNPDKTSAELANAMGMNAQSVRCMARKHNLQYTNKKPSVELIKKRIKFIEKNSHMTAKEVAAALNINETNVNNFVRSHGLKIKSVYSQLKPLTEKRIALIKANPDKTSAEIAEAYGDKRHAIYSVAIKYNLDIKRAAHINRPSGNSNRLIEKRNDLLMKKWA